MRFRLVKGSECKEIMACYVSARVQCRCRRFEVEAAIPAREIYMMTPLLLFCSSLSLGLELGNLGVQQEP